jgi:hypothetical protein
MNDMEVVEAYIGKSEYLLMTASSQAGPVTGPLVGDFVNVAGVRSRVTRREWVYETGMSLVRIYGVVERGSV